MVEEILDDKHATTIIQKILRLGGEARYSQLRALATKEKKMPIVTFHKRLRQLLESNIIETPQGHGRTKVAKRIYRLSPSVIKTLQPAYQHFQEMLKLAQKDVGERGFEEVFRSLQSEFNHIANVIVVDILLAGFKNPEILKSGALGLLLILRMMLIDLYEFMESVLTREKGAVNIKVSISREEWEGMEEWEQQLLQNLGLAPYNWRRSRP